MKCPACNKDMASDTGKYHYTESGLDNIYLSGVDIYNCDCGESMVSIPSIVDLHELIGLILVKKDTVLTGKEIKFLRKNAGLNGKKLSKIMGINNATLSRWENDNQTISESHDRFLRLIYLNIKTIPESEIQHLIKDSFATIKPKPKKISPFTIPIKDWAEPGLCTL